MVVRPEGVAPLGDFLFVEKGECKMAQVINVYQEIIEIREAVEEERRLSRFKRVVEDEDGNVFGIDKRTEKKVLIASAETARNEHLRFVR